LSVFGFFVIPASRLNGCRRTKGVGAGDKMENAHSG
jgi:hypothetical protein